MDAGLAAVLGALAGAVATTGAAFATGWATREQARIAARAEHQRQRRDAREAVYEKFINNVEALVSKTSIPFNSITQYPSLRPNLRELSSLNDTLGEITTKVTLAGPEHISKRATLINFYTVRLITILALIEVQITANENEVASEDWAKAQEDQEKLAQEFAGFSIDAQAVLDDDGTSRRGAPRRRCGK
ncbi:hypothetical protein [Streptomyces sp. NBC_00847]|uniref:hypothetical protein n=1 Tax=Streptomyces sp. NBC_00847 TaxID=2975850 RepID=UPI002251EB19|nr:hypothetical protein [Streptomyces sp. NBC_00847]MCX4881938.1 hypothetical protein [Streptomyces sp. NBC_00847]